MDWGGHKPKAGSRAFWPRKRAKRIYPRLKANDKEPKILGFAAYKAGMARVSVVGTKKDSPTTGVEVTRAVTILDCPALVVCGAKAYRSTAYGMDDVGTVWTDKFSKDLNRKTRMPKKPEKTMEFLEKMARELAEVRLIVHTKPRETGFGKKRPELFELPLGGDISQQLELAKSKLGTELKVSDIFGEGEWVDAMSVSKGKGFQGPVKRFGVTIQTRKASKKRRHVGTLGPKTPSRVLPGAVAMAGQLGFQTRTEWNKRVLKMGTDGISPDGGFISYGVVRGDYILLDGSVPGPKKRLIMLRPGIRAPESKEPVQLKQVFLDSHQ